MNQDTIFPSVWSYKSIAGITFMIISAKCYRNMSKRSQLSDALKYPDFSVWWFLELFIVTNFILTKRISGFLGYGDFKP